MDINDNQQINTFIKGMNTDVSDALMDNSQYRYAENVRLVTNTDSNSGEVRLIEGTQELDTNNTWHPHSIKAMTSIRDIIVVIDSISRIWIKNSTVNWNCIFEPNGEDDKFGEHLSLVSRYETPNLIKLYIADGKHQLMYINLADGNGGIKTEEDKIQGIENISSNVTTTLKAPIIGVSVNTGTIHPARVQYVYRFYNLGGSATTLSPLSNIISLYKTENEGYRPTDEHTNKAVNINIPENNTDQLDYLQIYRISYKQIGQQPSVSLVYDGPKIVYFIDTGYDIEDLSFEDLISQIKTDIIPQIIESKNDYLFAANVKYKQSDLNNIFDQIDVTAPSSGCIDGKYNKQMTDNVLTWDQLNWFKPGTTTIGGAGKYISWEYTWNTFTTDIKNKKTIPNTEVPSFRHGEVYRFGAVIYNSKGDRSDVKWIADIMIPETYQLISNHTGSTYTIPTKKGDTHSYNMYQIGVEFTVSQQLFNDYKDISAIEIVRAPRTISDRITITQGIVGIPYRIYTTENSDTNKQELVKTKYVCPTGIISTNLFFAYGGDDRNALSDAGYLMFASPEYVYQPDDIQNIMSQYNASIYVVPQYDIKIDTEQNTNVPDGGNLVFKSIVSPKPLDHSYWFAYYNISNIYNDDFLNENGIEKNQYGYNYQMEVAKKNNFTDWETKLISPNYYGKGSNWPNISAYHVIQSKDIISDINHSEILIKDSSFPSVPSSDSFSDDSGKLTWDTSVTITDDGDSFMQWSAPLLNKIKDPEDIMKNEKNFHHDNIWYNFPVFYPTGSIGKCIVFKLDSNFGIRYKEDLYFSVVNIKKKTLPYGGYDTIETGNYMSFGNIVYKDQTERITNVFSGDCYPGIFNYNASHAWEEANFYCGVRQAGFYSVPLESDIDLSATYGDLIVNVDSEYKYYLQDTAGSVNSNFSQQNDAYLYNTAYGALPDQLTYTALYTTYIDSNIYDTRVHHSEIKQNGQHIDQWLNFKAMNFIDVDSRFGAITNMRLFKDSMIYWQQNAIGILSINERTVLNDIDENQIVLGTGGVLQRYDYISTIYGMMPYQYEAEIQSNTTQYWWDGYNKEIMAYSGGMTCIPLAKTKNLSNYISANNGLQHPSLSYDKKYNELISNVVTDGALIYNEQMQQFTSIYTFYPQYRCNINDKLLLSNHQNIYKWNESSEEYTTLFGKDATPRIKYIVNNANTYTKVFDICTFGGRFYGGDDLSNITFTFDTPLKQHSTGTGNTLITNREYDFRLDIPRNNNSLYGDRMRGKTMQCEFSSNSNSTDFSLQYIITKYRMSCS